MFKLTTRLAVVSLAFLASTAFPAALQDWEFNINGSDYYPNLGSTFATIPGMTVTSAGGATTYTITYNPGVAGNYYIGAYFFDPVGTPFYNEYGTTNGSAAAGQTWQIDVPQYSAYTDSPTPPNNNGIGTIVDNLSNQALSNTNSVPGSTSNYLNDCGANGGGAANTTCNDFVSLATAYSFTLAANQEEIISFTLSSTDPGGFSVEAVHPVDGSNSTAAAIYLSATANGMQLGGGGNGTPEPSTFGLFGVASGCVGFMLMRRRVAARRS